MRDRALARSDPFDQLPEHDPDPTTRPIQRMMAKPVVFVAASAAVGWLAITGILWVAIRLI